MTLSSKTTSRTFRFKELYRSKQVKDALKKLQHDKCCLGGDPHFHTCVILDDWTQTSVKRGYLTSGLTASGAGVKLPVFRSDNTPGSDPFLNGY